MPPKAKISKEMIIEEAFQIVREEGADKITARRISERLKMFHPAGIILFCYCR